MKHRWLKIDWRGVFHTRPWPGWLLWRMNSAIEEHFQEALRRALNVKPFAEALRRSNELRVSAPTDANQDA